MQNTKDLTVVSLVTDPENLFDAEKGIYVTGNQFIKWKNSENYNPRKNVWDLNNKCNYFMRGAEWEREASITIFEKGTILLEQNLGIRIKGSSTRNTPCKSFNLMAKKKYETSIHWNSVCLKAKEMEIYRLKTKLKEEQSFLILNLKEFILTKKKIIIEIESI